VYGPTERSSDEFLGDFHHGLLGAPGAESGVGPTSLNGAQPAGHGSMTPENGVPARPPLTVAEAYARLAKIATDDERRL
jgi:hypothetical protein